MVLVFLKLGLHNACSSFHLLQVIRSVTWCWENLWAEWQLARVGQSLRALDYLQGWGRCALWTTPQMWKKPFSMDYYSGRMVTGTAPYGRCYWKLWRMQKFRYRISKNWRRKFSKVHFSTFNASSRPPLYFAQNQARKVLSKFEWWSVYWGCNVCYVTPWILPKWPSLFSCDLCPIFWHKLLTASAMTGSCDILHLLYSYGAYSKWECVPHTNIKEMWTILVFLPALMMMMYMYDDWRWRITATLVACVAETPR